MMNKKKFGLDESTIKMIHAILARHPQVESAIMYGSRAKGTFKKGSDIDLTLDGDNLTHSVVRDIEVELDDLLLPYSFDISILSDISNPDLIDHIKQVGKSFYTRP